MVERRVERLPLRRAAIALAAAIVLSGCDTVDNWIGAGEEPPLPGERISVMTLESAIEADPRLAGTPVVLPEPYVNADWPQPGGYADNVLHHLAASGSLDAVWRSQAGEGSGDDSRLTAVPVVADGRIYVLDAAATVRAFSEAGGDELWETLLAPEDEKPEEGFGGGVAYWEGRLYATTGFGEVLALDAATGDILWRTDVGVPIRAAPTVDGGRVFAITHDNQLNALAAEDGRILWDHRGITESAGILGSTSPAAAGAVIVVPYSSGELFALRVENGNVAWSDSLTRTGTLTSLSELNDIAGRPVIDRGRVFAISHAGRFVSIDLRTGERVWTRNIGGEQTPWVAGDFVFIVTENAEVLAVSRRDGRIRWLTALERFEDEEDREDPVAWSGPVLIGDRLVLVSSHGYAVSLSPYTGEVTGQIELPEGTFIPPVVAKETLYVLTDDASLVALR